MTIRWKRIRPQRENDMNDMKESRCAAQLKPLGGQPISRAVARGHRASLSCFSSHAGIPRSKRGHFA